jgi:soluble P-type ATPase
VLCARKKEEMHARQEQERSPLEERCIVEQCQHVFIVGDGAADRGVRGAAVALCGLGEGSEVIAERLIPVHVVV